MINLNDISLWSTKLKAKDSGAHFSLEVNSDKEWVATEFVKTLDDKFLYVVQPLTESGGQIGVTGLFALVLNDQEMKRVFGLT